MTHKTAYVYIYRYANPILAFFSFAVFGCWHPASPGQQEPVPESRGIHFCCPQPVHWYHPNFHLHPVYCGTLPGIKVQLQDNRMGKQSPHLVVMVKFPFAIPLVIFPSPFLFFLPSPLPSQPSTGLPLSFFLLKGGLPATAACQSLGFSKSHGGNFDCNGCCVNKIELIKLKRKFTQTYCWLDDVNM